MAKDYKELWKGVTNSTDESEAVRALAEILGDKEGRNFIPRLERKEAESCIELLDRVSRDAHLPLSPPQMISLGHQRGQPQIR